MSTKSESVSHITTEQLQSTIQSIINSGDPTQLTSKQIRQLTESQLSLNENGLITRKNEINNIIESIMKSSLQSSTIQPHTPSNNTTKRMLSEQSSYNNKKQRIDTNINNNDHDHTIGDNQVGDEFYIELGNKRRVQVSEFKGKTLINIREFYDANGEMKPGM